MHKIGAFGIVEESGQILVCHRRDMDMWDLPGGGVDPSESPWGAAIREVKEETGLDVEATGDYLLIHRPDQNEISFCFYFKCVGGTLETSDEVRDLRFVDPTSLPSPFNHEEKSLINILMQSELRKSAVVLQPGKSPREIYFELGPKDYANFDSSTTLLSVVGLSGQDFQI